MTGAAAIRPSMSDDKHTRLVEEAHRLHCAWLLALAILGEGRGTNLTIPHYSLYEIKRLKRCIDALRSVFRTVAEELFLEFRPHNFKVTKWMEQRFMEWKRSGFALFDLGRVHEVELAIGRLGHRRFMDIPPYAQVLMQGFNVGAGIRHPEHHLASDLALLYGLFLDSEKITAEAKGLRGAQTSEHSQSLGRSVILTCFNLLESFCNGLYAAYLFDHPEASEQPKNHPKGKKSKSREHSLSKKFVLYPSLMANIPELDLNQPPLRDLFGECKERRDAFVHCEPGPEPTRWGYVKEHRFHDVNRAIVDKTVALTYAAICLVWKAVHGRDRPSWLPKRGEDGRFDRAIPGLRLVRAQ